MSSRRSAAEAGWAQTKRQVDAASETLLEKGSVREVESKRFSWFSRRVLVESRNDQFIKAIHDVVLDERPRWVAAQRAGGAPPDFVIDRSDLEQFTCLVLGDPGEGDRSQRAVAEAIPKGKGDSDFMIVLSDVVYPSGDVNEYAEKFYEMYGEYPNPIYALPGNHDWYDGLDGLMWHFCGAEPLPRLSHRLSSFPLREWLVRLVWRKSSRVDREELLAKRDRLWSNTAGFPPQPGPYWAMETRHLVMVAIDTGVKGTVDHEQGQWLCQISRRLEKPKVLLTGKPLYVNGGYHPCKIEWGEGAPDAERYPTVDDVVSDPELGYVAAIGGDIHNYQRYTVPLGEADGPETVEAPREIQHIVSGGAGAFMSQTHSIPLVQDLDGPAPARPVSERGDLRLFPIRGDSLAFYAGELLSRIGGLLLGALIWLLTAGAFGYLLFTGDWALSDMVWLATAVAGAQLASAVIARPERRPRLLAHTLFLGLLAAGLAVFSSRNDEWGDAFSTWLIVLAAVALPVVILALTGLGARGLAAWYSLLLGSTALTFLVEDDVVQDLIRAAAIVVLAIALVALVAVVAARVRRRIRDEPPPPETKSRRARESKESSPGLAAVGIPLGVLVVVLMVALIWPSFDYHKVLGLATFVVAGLPLVYLVFVLSGLQLALSSGLRREFRDPERRAEIANQASKYMAERLGVKPVRREARAIDEVEPKLSRLFQRTYPRNKWLRTEPFHLFISEILDRDEPPLFKSFLELEVRHRSPVELRIRCWGVPGVPVGERTPADGELEQSPIELDGTPGSARA